eukprot:28729-Eustigmatos_ZCMA.PRE.1
MAATGEEGEAEALVSKRNRAKRLCKHEGCTQWRKAGGYCMGHAGPGFTKICQREGCNQADKGDSDLLGAVWLVVS